MPEDGPPAGFLPSRDDYAVLRSILDNPRAELRITAVDIAFLFLLGREIEREEAAALPFDDLTQVYLRTLRMAGDEGASVLVARKNVLVLIDQMVLMPTRSALNRHAAAYRIGPIGQELRRAYSFVDDEEASRLTAILKQMSLILEEGIRRLECSGEALHREFVRNTLMIVESLVEAAERRQGRIEYAHDLVRQKVEVLLQQRGSDSASLRLCEEIIDRATVTATELRDVLMREGTVVTRALSRLEDLAYGLDTAIVQICQGIGGDIFRVAQWTEDRFAQWTAFHSRVSDYIEFVARVDPDQLISRGLVTHLKWLGGKIDHDPMGMPLSPYGLPIAALPRYRGMGTFPEPERTRVLAVEESEHGERDEPHPDIRIAFDAALRVLIAGLAAGQRVCLHDLLAPYADWPARKLSLLAGRLKLAMPAFGRPDPFHSAAEDREMRPAGPGLSCETLCVVPRK